MWGNRGGLPVHSSGGCHLKMKQEQRENEMDSTDINNPELIRIKFLYWMYQSARDYGEQRFGNDNRDASNSCIDYTDAIADTTDTNCNTNTNKSNTDCYPGTDDNRN